MKNLVIFLTVIFAIVLIALPFIITSSREWIFDGHLVSVILGDIAIAVICFFIVNSLKPKS